MTYFSGEVRLRDLPKASKQAWLSAFCAVGCFAIVGYDLTKVLTAVQSGGDATAPWLWTTLLLALGLGNLWVVDRELREVSEP